MDEMKALAARVRHLEALETVMDHVSATTNAGQNIPNGAWTTVIFEDEVYDTGSEYNPATGIFTAGRTGYLHVSAFIIFEATTTWAATERAVLSLYRDGVQYTVMGRETDHSTSSVLVNTLGGTTIAVTAGQTVDVRLYQNSGAALALLADGTLNWVTFDWMP